MASARALSAGSGRVAVVTGGSGGIGAACVRALAASGLQVGVADLSPPAGDLRRVAFASCDVAHRQSIADAFSTLERSVGRPDVLVCAAGITTNSARVTDMDTTAWQRDLDVNLSGTFYAIQEALAPMAERQWGRIVVISSVAAYGGLHLQPGYAASKSALLGLVKSVSLEASRDGITCNAVLPGLIDTQPVQGMLPELREAHIAHTPAGRLGTAAEVAAAVDFLCSDAAGFITGTNVVVDGGFTLTPTSLASRRENRRRAAPYATEPLDH